MPGRSRSTHAAGAISFAHVASRAEGCVRTLRIYTPPRFDPAGPTRYPVLVMHDGQNLFARAHAGEAGSWRVDESLDALVGSGTFAPWIVVGVDHRGVDRIGDFSPWPDRRLAFEPRADRYASFLVDELLPWIDAHLPARSGPAARALAGSSLGGLVSLFVAAAHPAAFGRIAAFSPSVMWSDGRLTSLFSRELAGAHRIWLDAGAHERFDAGSFVLDYGGAARELAAHLDHVGYGPEALRFELDEAGGHDEASWGRRFPSALRWLARDAA